MPPNTCRQRENSHKYCLFENVLNQQPCYDFSVCISNILKISQQNYKFTMEYLSDMAIY